MSYSPRRTVTNYDRYGVKHTYEIQELDYVGGNTRIDTGIPVVNFEHEELPTSDRILKLYENPVVKGSLELNVLIENSTDFQLLQDIFDGGEDEFRIVWKQDGVTFWTGSILNDLLEYPESDYPYTAKIIAKDFSRLEGIDYTNTADGRGTVIEIIAELLDELGYTLNIETATSWISENTTSTVDFLQQHYIDRFALQTYARTGDESNEAITVFEALEKLCRNFCLILKQLDGVFVLEHLSAYSDPANVYLTVYDNLGAQVTATTQTDLTGNADTIIKESSQTTGYPGLKSVRVKFDHRTKISGITFPLDVDLADSQTESFSQFFASDGTQVIELSFDVYVETDIDEAEMDARVRITADTYYLQDDRSTWSATVNNYVELSMTKGKPLVGGGNLWRGSFSIVTDATPADADGTLTVQFAGASGTTDFADETQYTNISFNIDNAVADENSAFIDYKLTQTGKYSERYDHGVAWYGDGPVGYARSAISTDSGGANLTSDAWQRRGSVAYRNFFENVTKEVLDVQRTGIKRTDSDNEGQYDPRLVKAYRSSNYLYGGGTFDGDVWHPILIQINIQTGTDTFEDLPKFADEGSTGTTSGGSTGGGIDQSTADSRYFEKSKHLSEGTPATMRTNLGLVIGTDVQAWDTDLDNLAGGDGSNLTSVGALNAGSITSGFGSIDIGGSGFTGRSLNIVGSGTGDSNIGFIAFYDNDGITRRGVVGDVSSGDDDIYLLSDTGEVRLHRQGTTRLITTSDGISVTGNIAASESLTAVAATLSDKVALNGTGFEKISLTRGTGQSSIGISNNTDNMVFTAGDVSRGGFHEGELRWGGVAAGDKVIDSSRNFFGVNATLTGTLDVTGVATFADNVLSDGWTGADWANDGYRFQNAGDAVVETLRVRGRMEVYEFVAKQISYIGGKEILSIANGRVESTSGTDSVTVQDVRAQNATSFKVGDLWEIQVVDINNDLESGGTGSIVRNAYGAVTAVSGNVLTLSFTSGTIVDIEQNDLIVAYGSSDADRNSIMYRNVDRSDDRLITRVQTGVDARADLTAEANTRLAYGDIGDYTGSAYAETFGLFAGDISNEHVLITPTGAFFKDGTDIAAELSSSRFRIGDATNYVEYNASTAAFDIATDTFSLTAGSMTIDSTSGIAIDATNYFKQDKTFSFGGGLLSGTGTTLAISGAAASIDVSDFSLIAAGALKISSTDELIETISQHDGSDLVSRVSQGVFSVVHDSSEIADIGISDIAQFGRVSLKEPATPNNRLDLSARSIQHKSNDYGTVFSSSPLIGEVFFGADVVLAKQSESSSAAGAGSALPGSPEAYIPIQFKDSAGDIVQGMLAVWLPSDNTAPSDPSSLSLCDTGTALRADWTGSTDNVAVDHYEVHRSTDDVNYDVIATVDHPTTQYDDSKPVTNADTTYYYKIKAVDTSGNKSGFSNTASTTYNSATAC